MHKLSKLFFTIYFILTFIACTTFDFADTYAKTPYDDTATIQALLDTNESTVIIPKTANSRPYIVETLKLKNVKDKKITFEAGTIILAKSKAFKGEKDCLIELVNCKNVVLSGFGVSLKMRKEDYKGLDYTASKMRHAISILDCENITVEGFNIMKSGGDGVFIGQSNKDLDTLEIITHSKDIKLIHLTIENNYRHGICVTSVDGLLVDSCSIFGTTGLISSDGMYIEALDTTKALNNINVINSSFMFNRDSGIKIMLDNAKDIPFNIVFENCYSAKNILASFVLMQIPKTFKGTLKVINCNFKGVQFIRAPKSLILSTSK